MKKKKIEEYISLVPRIEFLWGKNIVKIDLYSKIAKLIIDAVGQYSFIDTKQLMKLQNKHSLRLLPILFKLTRYSDNVPKEPPMNSTNLMNFLAQNIKDLLKLSVKFLSL